MLWCLELPGQEAEVTVREELLWELTHLGPPDGALPPGTCPSQRGATGGGSERGGVAHRVFVNQAFSVA